MVGDSSQLACVCLFICLSVCLRSQLAREKSRKKKIELYSWLDRKRCIDMAPIVSAPTPLRNKSEFTFGYRYLFDETRKKEESEKKEGEGGPEKLEVPEDGDASKDEVMKESDGLKEEVSKEGETKDGDASKDESVKDSGPLKRNAPKEGESSSEEVAPKEPAKVPAVGFMVTGWAGGVSRPHCCENIPPEVCTIVEIVDEFLATSPLPPYDVKSHQGFWRTLTIRSSRRTQECMIIIMHTPAEGGIGDKQVEGSDHKEHFEKERARLVSVLTEAELPIPDQAPLKVTSIFFQEFDGLSHPGPEHPVQVSCGRQRLFPTIDRFCVAHLFHCCIHLTACLWQRVSHRKIRKVLLSDIPWSLLPGEY